MNRHMVEEAGSRFFELASSLGRIHADTLSGMADATSKTPLGPVFAMNATFARIAHEGMDTLSERLVNAKTAAPTPKAKAADPAPAPEAAEPDVMDVLVEADEVEDAPLPVIEPASTQDDLSIITGIGATTAKKLNSVGVESFAQIAAMDEGEFAVLLESLDIKSIRFSPAMWIAEAKTLAA